MIYVRCADKLIVGRIHQIPKTLYNAGNIVYIFLWRDACLLRFDLDFLAVLVRSRLEEHVISLLPLKPRNAVCQHNFIAVADMRLPRRIGDCRRHIRLFLFHSAFPFLWVK